MKLERDFQAGLIRELKEMFRGCLIFKMDGSNTPQGFPDLLILYKNKWAALECKQDKKSKHQPNQDYYVGLTNSMSFGAFISPENKGEVLYDLQRSFEDCWDARVSKS